MVKTWKLGVAIVGFCNNTHHEMEQATTSDNSSSNNKTNNSRGSSGKDNNKQQLVLFTPFCVRCNVENSFVLFFRCVWNFLDGLFLFALVYIRCSYQKANILHQYNKLEHHHHLDQEQNFSWLSQPFRWPVLGLPDQRLLNSLYNVVESLYNGFC